MLYVLGSNGSGQLGLGHIDDSRSPELGHTSSTIKGIAAGGNHTLILDEDGTVEGFGSNEHGQCNAGKFRAHCNDAQNGTVPFELQHNRSYSNGESVKVEQISATWNASVLLYSSGSVATCGQGLSGELGQGEGVADVAHLSTVPNFPPHHTTVVHIASSMAHTVAVLSNGEVWGWGKGRKGQLGEPAEDIWSPRKIGGIPFPAVKAVCGKDFTSVIGDHKEGRIHVLGFRKSDRFGLLASLPAAVPGWKDLAASWGSIFILKDDGSLLGFGRNDYGQLPPQCLPPIKAMAAGSEHCLALTKTGKVLAWGWGEHGNCGDLTDANGNVEGRWNEIEVPETAILVFAGCATSFIVAAVGAKQNGEQG